MAITARTRPDPGVRSSEISGRHAPTARPVHIPELVDPRHEHRLRRINLIARLMDDAMQLPGTNVRIGWDSVIGLVPGIGDVASACVSGWLVYEAKQLGLPKRKLARMLANMGADAAVGAIPLLGDFFDVAFKANRKNARIIHEHLGRKVE